MISRAPRPHWRSQHVIILFVAACLALVACNHSAPPAPTNTAATDTPRGASQPRTQPPLPPIASAHDAGGAMSADAARAQSWTLLDGRRVRASDYKGRVLVLDFWATYCPPCREEVPHLVALQRRYAAQGLNVVGLNVGGDDDRPKVPSFVEEFKISYPLGYPDDAMAAIVFADTDAIPQTYVFDRQGKLVKRFTGFDQSVAAGLESAVQTALASKAGS